MGLLIHTSFETPEGLAVTGVYCRIVEVTFRPTGGGLFAVAFRMEFFVDRPARLNGRHPIRVPTIGDGQTYVGEFGDITYLYGLLKTNLEEAGFSVEDVDPDPIPAPAPEPTPTEGPIEHPPAEPTPTEPTPTEPTPTEPTPTQPTPTEPTPTEPPTEPPAE